MYSNVCHLWLIKFENNEVNSLTRAVRNPLHITLLQLILTEKRPQTFERN